MSFSSSVEKAPQQVQTVRVFPNRDVIFPAGGLDDLASSVERLTRNNLVQAWIPKT
jgi:hypothetical protein